MNFKYNLTLSTSPPTQPAKKLRRTASPALRHLRARQRRNITGKERDSETGLYYYGARYLDPKASRWLSGDPAVGEYIPSAPVSDEARKRNGNLPGIGGVFNYANLRVYHYAGNNPVKYVDPDGRFIPNSDGSLIAEEGDDAVDLANFLGISVISVILHLSDRGYASDSIRPGDRITLDNVYTRSIANAINSPTTDQILSGEGWYVNDYNCWGSAIDGSKGNEIQRGIPTASEFDTILQLEYYMVDDTKVVFGKTVIRFSNDEETQHGAVFYGRSNDGTVYVYTKNGWHARPEVMRLSDLHSKIPSYGSVSGYYNLRD